MQRKFHKKYHYGIIEKISTSQVPTNSHFTVSQTFHPPHFVYKNKKKTSTITLDHNHSIAKVVPN